MDAVYLDQNYFRSVQCPRSTQESFERFKRVVSRLQADRLSVCIPGVAYSLETGGGVPLWEVLFAKSEEFGLSTADITDVSRLLERCQEFPAEIDESYGVAAAGVPSTSASYRFVYESPAGELAGVAVDASNQHGAFDISKDGRTKSVYFLTGHDNVLALYRHFLVIGGCEKEPFSRFFERAFPSIKTVGEMDPAKLGVDLTRHSDALVTHLAYLNDEYITSGHLVGWDLPKMQKNASAAGVDLSDESSNTKRDKAKMREREVRVVIDRDERVVECSMHTKIEPTRGRIHFSVEKCVSGRVVVVGIMCAHLSV